MTKKPWKREIDNDPLNEKSDDITVPGYTGTWYVIDQTSEFGPPLFLLESEQDGDESACLIVDNGEILFGTASTTDGTTWRKRKHPWTSCS